MKTAILARPRQAFRKVKDLTSWARDGGSHPSQPDHLPLHRSCWPSTWLGWPAPEDDALPCSLSVLTSSCNTANSVRNASIAARNSSTARCDAASSASESTLARTSSSALDDANVDGSEAVSGVRAPHHVEGKLRVHVDDGAAGAAGAAGRRTTRRPRFPIMSGRPCTLIHSCLASLRFQGHGDFVGMGARVGAPNKIHHNRRWRLGFAAWVPLPCLGVRALLTGALLLGRTEADACAWSRPRESGRSTLALCT